MKFGSLILVWFVPVYDQLTHNWHPMGDYYYYYLFYEIAILYPYGRYKNVTQLFLFFRFVYRIVVIFKFLFINSSIFLITDL